MSVTESLTTFGRQTVVGSGGARGNSSGRGRGRGGGLGIGGGNGGRGPTDDDATTYLSAVAAADGQPLEAGFQAAVVEFVAREKAAGRWNKLGTIWFSGPRTWAGLLITLKGPRPTSNNFIPGEYEGGGATAREQGPISSVAQSRYFNTNTPISSNPANDRHIAVNLAVADSAAAAYGTYIGAQSSAPNEASDLIWKHSNGTQTSVRLGSGNVPLISGRHAGFHAVTRNDLTNFTYRVNNTTTTAADVATETGSSTIPYFVFADNNVGTPRLFTAARINFYSIGGHISDLAAYQTSVSTMLNAIATAIV